MREREKREDGELTIFHPFFLLSFRPHVGTVSRFSELSCFSTGRARTDPFSFRFSSLL